MDGELHPRALFAMNEEWAIIKDFLEKRRNSEKTTGGMTFMEDKTTVFNGKKYIVEKDFIEAVNRAIDRLIAVYNVTKFDASKLERLGIVRHSAKNINGDDIKALCVDDIMEAIKNVLESKASSYNAANTNKIIAAVMNRALCELDPEAENMFPRSESATKEFFKDTDAYATTGYHSKRALDKAKEQPEKTLSEITAFINSNERNMKRINSRIKEIKKASRKLEKELKNKSSRLNEVRNRNAELKEEVIRRLSKSLAEDKKQMIAA